MAAITSFQPGGYPGRPYGAFNHAATVTVAITGTITASATETDIRLGGKTIIITLTNDTWAAAGATFDAQRQNIINGLDSGQAEALGWDAIVKAGLAVTAVVRTSATVVTVTLSAFAAYDITATETITVTVPASALVTSLTPVVGTPTFTVSAVAPPSVSTDIRNFEEHRERERLGLPRRSLIAQIKDYGIEEPAAEVIAAVAVRQAQALPDEQQRLDELQGELQLAGLQIESRYIEALNLERERLMDAEIGQRLRAMQQDNANRIILMLMALA